MTSRRDVTDVTRVNITNVTFENVKFLKSWIEDAMWRIMKIIQTSNDFYRKVDDQKRKFENRLILRQN